MYQTARVIVVSKTVAPTSTVKALKELGAVSEASFGSRFARSGPIRETLMTYLVAAGADGGYGYFAPAVPDSCALTFQLRYSDGRTETQITHSANTPLGLRIGSLLEQIGGISSPKLSEHMLKNFATVLLRQHPKLNNGRISLWRVPSPTIEEHTRGERPKPALLCTHDFDRVATPDLSLE
jgi:hypothetical protein